MLTTISPPVCASCRPLEWDGGAQHHPGLASYAVGDGPIRSDGGHQRGRPRPAEETARLPACSHDENLGGIELRPADHVRSTDSSTTRSERFPSSVGLS